MSISPGNGLFYIIRKVIYIQIQIQEVFGQTLKKEEMV